MAFQTVVAAASRFAAIVQVLHAIPCFHPIVGADRGGLQGAFSTGQLVARDVVRPVTRPTTRPKLVGLGLELVTHCAQAADAGGGLEQDLPDVVGRVQDVVATRHQPCMIQAKHLVEEGSV